MRGLVAFRGLVTGWLAKAMRRGRREEVALAAAILGARWEEPWTTARSTGPPRPDENGVGRAWATCAREARWRGRQGVDGWIERRRVGGVRLRDDALRRVRLGEGLNGRAWRRHVDPPRVLNPRAKGEHRTVRVDRHGAVSHGVREVRVGGEVVRDCVAPRVEVPLLAARQGLKLRHGGAHRGSTGRCCPSRAAGGHPAWRWRRPRAARSERESSRVSSCRAQRVHQGRALRSGLRHCHSGSRSERAEPKEGGG